MSTLRVVPDQPARLTDRVAAEVRASMARTRMTQTGLAEVLGLTQSAVSKRLRGKIAFSVDELEKAADALGVHPAVLLGGSSGDSPQPPRPTTDR
jgi:transcriptional regulator with XRE-family HTH domain